MTLPWENYFYMISNYVQQLRTEGFLSYIEFCLHQLEILGSLTNPTKIHVGRPKYKASIHKSNRKLKFDPKNVIIIILFHQAPSETRDHRSISRVSEVHPLDASKIQLFLVLQSSQCVLLLTMLSSLA